MQNTPTSYNRQNNQQPRPIMTGTNLFASNKILIANGPNLGRLGTREPEVYGHQDLKKLRELCVQWAHQVGFDVDVRQTDEETEMVHWMHQAVDRRSPVVMNPAAFTHYSYALRDAAVQVTDAGIPLIEVHISNPAARETFRRYSVISPIATGTITGMGFYGYKLAIEAIAVAVTSSQQAARQ